MSKQYYDYEQKGLFDPSKQPDIAHFSPRDVELHIEDAEKDFLSLQRKMVRLDARKKASRSKTSKSQA